MTYPLPPRRSPEGRQAALRILCTTDLHCAILPYDYIADRPAPGTGLADASHLIDALRAEGPECILLDNGDLIEGSPMSDWIAAALAEGRIDAHPMIAAMNHLRYDAATIGNHDFAYGLPFLRDCIRAAGFPFVSANVVAAAGAATPPPAPPFTILTRSVTDGAGQRQPIRIGVIGFAPPQTADWESLAFDGALATQDIVRTAEDLVPALRAQGADLVVALCHSGITGPDRAGAVAHGPGPENAAVALAGVPGIDALVLGHTHRVFPGPDHPLCPVIDPVAGTLSGKPAVMAGYRGSHVGVIDLTLDPAPGGGWTVAGHAAHALPVRPGPPRDDDFPPMVRMAHKGLKHDMRRQIGRTAVPLHSYCARIGPCPSLALLAEAQFHAAWPLIARSDAAQLPVLSAVAPFRTGGIYGPGHFVDLPAGPLLRRHAAELYPYINHLCVIEIDGAGLAEWLERSASGFARVTPGLSDQPLLNPDEPGYNFDVISGVRCTIDPSRPPRYSLDGALLDPAARRVSDLTHQGRAVRPEDRFAVVSNSYRAGGGGGFVAARAGRRIAISDLSNRAALEAYIAMVPFVAPQPMASWRFARLAPGTAAWVDSGPGVRAHLDTMSGVSLTGPLPDGGLRLSVRLDL